MIIIPLDRRLDWSRPPVVTLTLILVNVLCFFVWQSGDDQRYSEAMTYYSESGLAQQELTRYLRFQDGDAGNALPEGLSADGPEVYPLYFEMLEDTRFMRELLAEKIITPADENYAQWRERRRQFGELLSQVVIIHYGLRTAAPRWDSLISHMFLHGDFMHLLGNMIFLLAVGLLVEATLGSWAYLLCYLLVGLGSATFDFIFLPTHFSPSIGASGAIAGLMGMYTVLYWTRRIRFFYFIFVYFDYVTLPAIALLPLWIGNELFQILTDHDSNINYYAHLGGLVTGALVGWGVRSYLPAFNDQFLQEEDRQSDFEQRLQQAQQLCHQLEYRKAVNLLKRLHNEQPDDQSVLAHLQEAARIEPEGETYHHASRRILMRPAPDPAARQLRLEVFHDYLRSARPRPRLGRQLVCDLIHWFVTIGALKEAELLAMNLIKRKGECSDQPAMLHRLADLAAEKGHAEKSKFYRGVANQTGLNCT